MSVVRKSRTNALQELVQFLWARKLWWMIPMLLVLFTFGALIMMAQTSVVAPFIYVLF